MELDPSIFTPEGKPEMERLLLDTSKKVLAHDEFALVELIKMLGGHASHLSSNLVDFAGYEESEAHEEAWHSTWEMLRDVLDRRLGSATLHIANLIDRNSSRFFDTTLDASKVPVDASMRAFMMVFEGSISSIRD